MAISQIGTASISGLGYGFKNRLINGAFNFWQRGTSFSSSSVNEYSADRWRTEGYPVSGGTVISQQTFAAGQTAVPGFPQYYVQIQTNGAIASGQYWAYQQRIEAPQNLTGYETVTLSFWAKVPSGTLAASAFAYGVVNLTNSPALTTTWQKISVTQTLSSGYGSGYVSVYVVYLPAGTAATTVQIANVQVEIGTVATDFDYRPYGTELALCQRYYEKSYNIDVAPGSVSDLGGILHRPPGTSINITTPFKVAKRASPSVTVYSTVTGTSSKFRNYTSGADLTIGGVAFIGMWAASPYSDAATANNQYGFQFVAESEL